MRWAHGIAHAAIDFPNSHDGMWSAPDQTEEFRKAVLTYCQTYMGDVDGQTRKESHHE